MVVEQQAVPVPRRNHGPDTFSPFECGEQVNVWDLNVESSPNWILKNHVNDCLYQGGESSLRRSIVEIKTYEELYTGQIFYYNFLFWKYSRWFWSVIQGNHSCWQLVMKSHKFLVYHFPWDLLTPGLSKQLSEYSSPKTHFLVFRASLTWCCFPDFKCWTDDFVLCRSNNSYNLKVQTLKFQYSNIEISKFEIQTLNFQHLKI